ncbi:hypothetical protein J2T15_001841 [Paenibacillus harenae]|uniref:Uncharacterized protein n=1 Tax=Paenibacillus harenae TaxID=306543 RepID=A0ABT9TZX0_PAEHA|nr:hypothetical protein [Paenibacillus harenae]MDQ0112406.1 hypothetical protein [Paenibacillus harenae]
MCVSLAAFQAADGTFFCAFLEESHWHWRIILVALDQRMEVDDDAGNHAQL